MNVSAKQGCELTKDGEAWSDAMRYPAEYAAFTGKEVPSAPVSILEGCWAAQRRG